MPATSLRTRIGAAVAAASVLAIAAAGTAAAASPRATTHGASSIGSTTARLNGAVDPNREATTYYFDFGTTTSYGTRTTSRSTGAGNGATNVSASISGLTPGTTYHFRIVASNASGTTFGGDESFVTDAPPVVQTGTAQNVSATSAMLTGSADPRGRSTNAYYELGTTTSYGTRTATQNLGSSPGAKGVSVQLSNLTPATTYHYRLVASNNVGTTHGSDLTFTTLAAVTITEHDLKTVGGHLARLAGTVTGAGAGVQVTILAQEFGSNAFTTVATTMTGATGNWAYLARPNITTSYEAQANGGTSSAVTIGAAPAVSFQRITGARFSTTVRAKNSFAGKLVKLQRLVGDRWVTLKQTRLNARSAAIFPAALLPRGVASSLRVAMSVNQAGPGYLGGLSRTLVYRRA